MKLHKNITQCYRTSVEETYNHVMTVSIKYWQEADFKWGWEKVGEYSRSGKQFFKTFHPFVVEDKAYALYSPFINATRIMSLPDCKDIGGEDPPGDDFCPFEYYIPDLCTRLPSPNDPEPLVANHDHKRWAHEVLEAVGVRIYWPDSADHPAPDKDERIAYLDEKEKSHTAHKAWVRRNPCTYHPANFGFVAGKYWAMSGNPQLQYLDLSRAAEGILVRSDPFKDYIELPDGIDLAKCIDMESWAYNYPLVKVAAMQYLWTDGREQKEESIK